MTTFLQQHDVSTPSSADRRKSLSVPTSLAHRLLLFLAVMLMGVNCAWAEEVTLFTTNFSTADGWSTESIITSTTTSATKTINGTTVSFKGYKTTDLKVEVGNTTSADGTLTFTGNNISASAGDASSANYYMAIPVSDVNGSVTITTTGDATKWYYTYDDGSNGTIVARQQASDNGGFTISDLKSSNVTIYIGSSGKKLNSITITTPSGSTPAANYTINYNGNGNTGGSAPTDSNSPYASGSQITILGNTGNLVKTGYTFGGWQIDRTGTIYNAGDKYTINGNRTFYAVWNEAAPVVKSTITDTETGCAGKNIVLPTIPAAQGTALTFESNARYSIPVINSRLNNFDANTTAMGFGVFSDAGEKTTDEAGTKSNLDYVPGLVGKAVLEAVDYYKNNTDVDVKPWFYAIQHYANKYDIKDAGKNGQSFDDLNAVKMYSLLNKFAVNSTFPDGSLYTNAQTRTAVENRYKDALSGIRKANTSYAITSTTNTNAAGGWWHKSSYDNQMWCDGQYMGPALFATMINDFESYSAVASTGTDWDLITKQFNISWNYLWNDSKKLLYHAFSATPSASTSSAWAKTVCSYDKTCSTNSAFWGRADGWYFLALVDVLEQMDKAGIPHSDANYTSLRTKLNTLAAGIAARQDATSGCWYQVLDETSSSLSGNYLESSATAIFLTAYMKGHRLGYIDADYTSLIKKGYSGFVENFMISDGNGGIHLINCCRSAGLGGSNNRKGDNDYYLNGSDVTKTTNNTEGKVLGAFIMAATEYERAYLEESEEPGDEVDGSIKWINMASTGHNANTSGTATSVGITPTDGKVVGMTTNKTTASIVIDGNNASRYTGFGATADKDNYYFEYSFNVADGYTFTPSEINIAWAPNGSKSVTLDVYVGTSESNLTKITTLSHSSDNTYQEDKYNYTTPFTIVRLVPGGNNKSIVLNSVVINGQVTEPEARVYTVSFNNNGHSGNTPDAVMESEIGAGVTLPATGGKQGLTPHAGYTFLGWSIDQNATKADEGLEAFQTTYYPVSDVTLYAVYRQNPVGSAHTAFWHAFSDFTKLEMNKAYTATFHLSGGSHDYFENWALIATNNDNGHYFDGVQSDGTNELFVLRGDGGSWGNQQGTSQLYKYNAETLAYEEFTIGDASSADAKAAFIADMANANVKVSVARAGKKVHIYVTTECENGAKYVLTHISNEISGDMYLSFTTEYSSLGSFTADAESAANYLKKAEDIEGGSIEKLVSLEGIDITGWGVAEGTQFNAVVTAEAGYTFKDLTINGASAGTGVLTMPDVEATVSAVFDSEPAVQYSYIVKAVGPDGIVLNDNIANGTYTAGEAAITVAYPQHILVDSELYEIEKQYNGSGDYFRYTFTPDADDYVVNLPYTKNKVSNVVAYVEAENISGFAGTAGNTARASNGAAARKDQLCATGVQLQTDKTYQIFFRMVNGDNARTVIFNDGTNNIYSQEVGKADYSTKNSGLFSVSSNTELKVSCAGSTSSGLDWFYVQEVNALNVTENGQKYGFTQSNVETDKFASANGASMSSSTTKDGVEGMFYNIKKSSNYVEVTETGAIAFTVYAYHGNSKDTRNVDVYVDDEKVGTVAVTPGAGVTSSVFTIPAPQNGIHTIKMTGNGDDVYVADVVFYTEKVAPTVTPANVSVAVLQEKQFTISAPDGCDITSMETVNSEYADVEYADGKITVTGKKPGNVTATFYVTSENDLFNSGTATVNITVTKAELVMKYNPDAVIIEKGATKSLPQGLKIDYYVVEDGEERLLNTAPVTPGSYTTTDGTVATVDGSGNISFGIAAGSTDITASFAGNTQYSAAKASFSVTVKDGFEYKMSGEDGAAGPSLDDDTRKFTLMDDSSNPLVYGTFGGWKRNSHLSQGASKADGWQKLATYNNAIDGYSKYTSGINDAQNEDMAPSENIIYGSIRKGWFESPVTVNEDGTMQMNGTPAPFSLPVRGTYMTFEPTKNGQLTIYILQNGAWNSSKKDVKDDDGFLVSVDQSGTAIAFPKMAPWQFRPHSFYVVDQNGVPVELYTKFDINTKQPIETGIISEKDLDSKDSKGNYTYSEAQRNMVRAYCEKYGVKLGEKFKCIIDPSADGYYDATNIGNWKEFKQYMSDAEQKRVAAAWNTGVNGAEKVVKLDNGSYLAVDECIMKYSFHVAAGQTYYLFSNFSKMGFSGCNFVPDTDVSAHPRAIMTLSDVEAYTAPALNATVGQGNNVKNISVPQYETITLNRSFTAGNWETICLPFTMTEKEVRDNFGDDTELIIMNGTSISGTALNINFVYHEIQSILAGYPYLIKPANTISAITVKNKVIDPATSLTTFDGGDYTFTGISGYSTANVTSPSGKTGYSVLTKDGDVFLSGNKLYISQGKSVIKGYRAYIQLKDGVTPQAKSVTLSFGNIWDEDNDDNNVSTILRGVEADDIMDMAGLRDAKGVYNLNGQKVGNTMNNLPAGIYVINGKKTVIK